MKKFIITTILIMLWVYPVFADETIYSWTDKDGIVHFGNQPPPDDIDKFNATKVAPDDSASDATTEESRPGYDSMVDDARNQIQLNEIETVQKEIERAKKEKQQAEENKKAQNEAKRKELQDKIDALNKRPLSRTFDTAFRNAQIGMIQKQIDKLDKTQ